MIGFWKDSPALESRLEGVVARLAETVGEAGFPFDDLNETAAEPGGKLLRPALLLIGSEFGAPADPKRVESLAAAVEILHLATLIHDDILDEAPIRRGKPSLHSSVGVKQAVLAGDWLFSRCFLLSAESAGPDNAKLLARLIAAICSAEIVQDSAKYSFKAGPRDYYRMIAGKTAALFSLALSAGAAEAKAGRVTVQTLRRAGYSMGMAFQVIDDILDFTADEAVARKPVGKDIAEGLCTLPLVYALGIDPGLRKLLQSVAEAKDPDSRTEAARETAARVVELGAVEMAREDARRFTARAQREIERLKPGRAKDELSSLAQRLLVRTY